MPLKQLLPDYRAIEEPREIFDRMVGERGPLVVLDISVPEEVLALRLATRRICSKCGSNASIEWIDACAKCDGELVTRVDDGIDIVRERLKVYQRQTRPLKLG